MGEKGLFGPVNCGSKPPEPLVVEGRPAECSSLAKEGLNIGGQDAGEKKLLEVVVRPVKKGGPEELPQVSSRRSYSVVSRR